MLLDSDVLVDVARRHQPAAAWFAGLTGKPLVPGYAALELISGCRDRADLRRVSGILADVQQVWLPSGELDALVAGFGSIRLRDGIGIIDALIGFTAIWLGVPLATFNVRHYRAIPGLQTVQPYER